MKLAARTLLLICVILAVSAPLFLNLGAQPLRVWDESRNAVNAQEMIKDGDFIVPHFRGKPEMWNTKPPLVIWCQVVSIKLFGMTEFAIRLPSAVAGLATCVLLFWFGRIYFNSEFTGTFSALILVSTLGFVSYHVTRTGDLDAFLTLFTSASLLCFYLYTETKNKKYLQWFFTSAALAVLSKSIVVFLFIPGVILYLLFTKKIKITLQNKELYRQSYLFIAPVLGYYLLREYYNPGYLSAVYKNEIAGRYFESIENHSESFWFYFDNILSERYSYWIFPALAALILGIFASEQRLKKINFYIFGCVLTFLLILSTAKSKIAWYDAPIYPLLAIGIAVQINAIIEMITNRFNLRKYIKYMYKVSLVIALIGVPYVTVFKNVSRVEELEHEKDFYAIEYFLRDNETKVSELKAPHVVYDGYDVQVEFYVNRYQMNGMNIELVPSQNVQVGDEIIVCQAEVLDQLKDQFHIEIRNKRPYITIGLVKGLKLTKHKKRPTKL